MGHATEMKKIVKCWNTNNVECNQSSMQLKN